MNNTKRHTLRVRQADIGIFDAMKTGAKKIETRAATSKNLKIHAGDTLIIKCGSKSLEINIKKAEHYKSLDALLKKHNYKHIDPSSSSATELKAKIYSFPGYRQKITQYGIMAFSL